MPPNNNDNERQRPPGGDAGAHGQAALLLIEATLHALVEAKAFTVGEALSIVETAAEVKLDVAEANGESTASMEEALLLLQKIAHSLRGGR
ncbi:hypothetical protein M0208_02620 [Sphingomonas sp. SUN019]|uniref:hypothetical protein n=1 Tax=Sphingomonas sp. SUN019 TaxID=2937788 RepID=UPI0021641177|nr:hypothetical protein [Sphingomonas sp. SUN019]UVO49458.1 hypothetical protein M0208_02620 [Sphingomonas sp. SUN019]